MQILLALLPSVALSAVPGDSAGWQSLSTRPVPIECTEVSGEPWCRSRGVVSAPIDQVSDALRNMRHNADAFESVVSIGILEEDVLHITLDYPFPLSDRDYVARYSFATEGDTQVLSWEPATHAGAPVGGNVRLPKFAGEWRLSPRAEGTLVQYTWHADVGGRLPAAAYDTARKKAGHEALKDLAHTQQASLSAP